MFSGPRAGVQLYSAGTVGARADRGRVASGDGRGARGLASTGYSVDSDAGQAIGCHVEQTLGAPHSPALFHVQQEWAKGTAGVLATKTRQAEHALIQAKREWERQSQAPTASGAKPGPGPRPTASSGAMASDRRRGGVGGGARPAGNSGHQPRLSSLSSGNGSAPKQGFREQWNGKSIFKRVTVTP